MDIFRLRLQDDQRLSVRIKQEEINKPVGGLLEIGTKIIKAILRDLDVRLQHNVGRTLRIVEEPPPGIFQQAVDPDPGFCFLVRQTTPLSLMPR